jgi:hypothetical protein
VAALHVESSTCRIGSRHRSGASGGWSRAASWTSPAEALLGRLASSTNSEGPRRSGRRRPDARGVGSLDASLMRALAFTWWPTRNEMVPGRCSAGRPAGEWSSTLSRIWLCSSIGWIVTVWFLAFSPVGLAAGWHVRTVPDALLSSVSCVSRSDCTFAGSQAYRPLLERWRSGHWSREPIELPSRVRPNLRAVTCTSDDACRALGGYGFESDAGFRYVILHWNGVVWTLEKSFPPFVSVLGLSCASDTSCLGTGQTQSGSCNAMVEHWDGHRWTRPSGTCLDGELTTASCSTTFACGIGGIAGLGQCGGGSSPIRPLGGQPHRRGVLAGFQPIRGGVRARVPRIPARAPAGVVRVA